jgi:hypothetical protein
MNIILILVCGFLYNKLFVFMLKQMELWGGKPLHVGLLFIKCFVSKYTMHSVIKYSNKINEFLQSLSSISLNLMCTSQDNIHSFLSLPHRPLQTHSQHVSLHLFVGGKLSSFIALTTEKSSHQHLKYEFLYISAVMFLIHYNYP